MTRRSSVFLVEDHVSVRQLLRAHLEMEDAFEVVGEAGDSATALANCVRLQPDVVVLDLLLPGMTGQKLIEALRQNGCHSKILVFSSACDSRTLRELWSLGATCVVEKTASIECFMAALGSLLHEGSQPTRLVVRTELEQSRPLADSEMATGISQQERLVAKLVAAGLTSKDIANELGLSTRTVSNHRYRLMRKLGARNAIEMVRKVQEFDAL